jgi:hypothetical protein
MSSIATNWAAGRIRGNLAAAAWPPNHKSK